MYFIYRYKGLNTLSGIIRNGSVCLVVLSVCMPAVTWRAIMLGHIACDIMHSKWRFLRAHSFVGTPTSLPVLDLEQPSWRGIILPPTGTSVCSPLCFCGNWTAVVMGLFRVWGAFLCFQTNDNKRTILHFCESYVCSVSICSYVNIYIYVQCIISFVGSQWKAAEICDMCIVISDHQSKCYQILSFLKRQNKTCASLPHQPATPAPALLPSQSAVSLAQPPAFPVLGLVSGLRPEDWSTTGQGCDFSPWVCLHQIHLGSFRIVRSANSDVVGTGPGLSCFAMGSL